MDALENKPASLEKEKDLNEPQLSRMSRGSSRGSRDQGSGRSGKDTRSGATCSTCLAEHAEQMDALENKLASKRKRLRTAAAVKDAQEEAREAAETKEAAALQGYKKRATCSRGPS